MDRYEGRYKRKVRSLRDRLIDDATKFYSDTGRVYSDLLFDEFRKEILEIARSNSDRIISNISGRTSRQMARRYAEVVRIIDRIDNLGFHTFLANDWTNSFGLTKSRLVTDTAFRDLQQVLQKGIEEELSREQIIKNLRDVKKLSKYRASVIARTETHQALSFAQEGTWRRIEAEVNGDIYKKWQHSGDNRVRDPHERMSSHPAVKLDDYFTVMGEKLLRPGDPNGSPANVIQCRCVMTSELVFRNE